MLSLSESHTSVSSSVAAAPVSAPAAPISLSTAIPAIIGAPDHQMGQARRLAAHCRALDGTEVRIIPVSASNAIYRKKYPNAPLACVQVDGLLHCARELRGQPFFWLESDSIPLHPGWLQRLTTEYHRLGRPYLLSSDAHPPHDLVGGIGFYGPDTAWMLPDYYPRASWDLWMLKHIPELVARTDLIQHSYGIYDAKGDVSPHMFPRDRAIIRANAQVFHRDRFQGLIPGQHRFLHSGDLGDIIAALPIIRQLGGGDLVLTNYPHTKQHMRPIEPRVSNIAPLLCVQPYIRSVTYDAKPEGITCDFTDFRTSFKTHDTLTASQAAHVGAGAIDMCKWLHVTPNTAMRGRIIVNRSARYHNPQFPWPKLVRANRDKMCFCGTREEYLDFTRAFGAIEYVETPNLLVLAEHIAGSSLFIGNQSCACWIAMALAHPLYQETRASGPDSMVLRTNAIYIPDNGAKHFKPPYRLL